MPLPKARLPKVKSQYLRASDRLYYEGKQKHRYGKINEILGEIASDIVEDFDLPKAKICAEKSELPKMAKVGVKDFLEMKRQIFYSNYNMMVKSESLEQLHCYVKQHEDIQKKEEKTASQTKAILKEFMKQEAEKVRRLKEDHLKLDEQKQQALGKLAFLKNQILEEEQQTNKIKDEIQVKLSN